MDDYTIQSTPQHPERYVTLIAPGEIEMYVDATGEVTHVFLRPEWNEVEVEGPLAGEFDDGRILAAIEAGKEKFPENTR